MYSADKKPEESAVILARKGTAGLTLASALWKTAQAIWNKHSSSVCRKKLTSNPLTKVARWVCHLADKLIINCSPYLCFALRVGELLCQSCLAHPGRHLHPAKPWEVYCKYECALWSSWLHTTIRWLLIICDSMEENLTEGNDGSACFRPIINGWKCHIIKLHWIHYELQSIQKYTVSRCHTSELDFQRSF